MDLIEDDPLDVREVLAELRGPQDARDAFRSRDEDVGRPTDLTLALLGGRVPGADADADGRHRLPFPLRELRELTKRLLEVAVDVVREGLERGNVQAIDPLLEFSPELLRIQLVDDREIGRASCRERV